MNYNSINKINETLTNLEKAYSADLVTVVDFMQMFQDARDSITRAFKNNKIDMNYYLLYSNNLASLSINNRFRGK